MDTQSVAQPNTFEMMESADEQMVLDEIKGRAMDALVYEIHQGGQTVTGLSLAGVRETARVMNANGKARIGISDREPVITETDDYFEVKVFAQDAQNGGGYWGIKRQPKKYANGSVNQFALEQALAKSQRNAMRGLIPEWFTKEMIDAFRARGGAKTLAAQTRRVQPQAQVHAAPTPEKEKKPSIRILTKEYSNLIKEIGALDYYKANGQPDTFHIIGAVAKLGYTEITDTNIAEVKGALIQYARDNTAMQAKEKAAA